MQEDLASVLIDAVPLIDEYSHIVEKSLTFKGMSLEEWSSVIATPPIHDKMTITEVHGFNVKFIQLNEIIMSNLSYSKAYYDMATAKYHSSLKSAMNTLMNRINNDSTRKMPGIDSLEKMAAVTCSNEQVAMDISKMFYEFWKIHADKMKGLDSRLNNISYMVRN